MHKLPFLNLSLKELDVEITNVLHNIKYGDEKYTSYLKDMELEGVEKMSKKQFRNLCIMSTFIQAAYEIKEIEPPSWVTDKRLVMDKAYRNRETDYLDIFEAYQAEYDHNVFYPKSSFDVI